MTNNITPAYSYERASELAGTINAYWFDRGYEAGARPFVFREDKDEGRMWGVTSSLVSGLPTERATKVAA
jgi:hypothetical protein